MILLKFVFTYLMGVCAGLNIGAALMGGKNDNNARIGSSHRMGLPKEDSKNDDTDLGGDR